MASTTIVHLIDDIDGSQAERSVEFGLDGVSYTIDLSAAHIAELQTILGPYIAAARRVDRGRVERVILTRTPRGTAAEASRASKDRNAEIRAWAADNGQPLAGRGRIPRSVEDAYRKAMAQPAAKEAQAPAEAPAEAKPRRSRKVPAATFSGNEQ
jgi:hypothetical protein